jgi:hypothetical protein
VGNFILAILGILNLAVTLDPGLPQYQFFSLFPFLPRLSSLARMASEEERNLYHKLAFGGAFHAAADRALSLSRTFCVWFLTPPPFPGRRRSPTLLYARAACGLKEMGPKPNTSYTASRQVSSASS